MKSKSNSLSIVQKIKNKIRLYFENIILRYYSTIDYLYFHKLTRDKKIKNINYYYSVSGELYINALLNFSLIGILQKENIPKVNKLGLNQKVIIFIDDKNEKEKIKKHKNIIKLKKFCDVQIIFDNRKYDRFLDFKKSIEMSLNNDSLCVFLNPDMFFGNKSIFNAIKLASIIEKDVLLYQHARVSWEEGFKYINNTFYKKKQQTIENRKLVEFALKNLHKPQKKLFKEKFNLTSKSGLSMKMLDNDNCAVVASRMNAFSARFCKSDLAFFKFFRSFNHTDFTWTRKLFREQRVSVISDSDILFAIELTMKNKNPTKLIRSNKIQNYAEPFRMSNHIINESFITFYKKN